MSFQKQITVLPLSNGEPEMLRARVTTQRCAIACYIIAIHVIFSPLLFLCSFKRYFPVMDIHRVLI